MNLAVASPQQSQADFPPTCIAIISSKKMESFLSVQVEVYDNPRLEQNKFGFDIEISDSNKTNSGL